MSGSSRKIIHVDMDAFYTSVEQRDDPSLRGRPIVVGGSPEGRGVVAAASYEARKFGVRSAMSSAKAIRLCPELLFVPARFDVYRLVSRRIRAIFCSYTELVEPLALDEAYLDVTENLVGAPFATPIAKEIRARIRDELGLIASAGIGPTKFVAKLASDYDKPDGLVIVPPSRVQEFIWPLPVDRLWGVGPATAKRIRGLGLETIGDVARASRAEIERRLGRHGGFVYNLSRGIDPRRVTPTRLPKSRGAERTFPSDVKDLHALEGFVAGLVEELWPSLRRIESGARTITIKVRYEDFRTITRSRSLESPTNDPDQIRTVALELLRTTEAGQTPVRLVGVTASNFGRRGDSRQLQLPFVDDKNED